MPGSGPCASGSRGGVLRNGGDRHRDGGRRLPFGREPREQLHGGIRRVRCRIRGPGNEERSLAVIEEIVRLAPGKPIRWVITSHPHFDHIGGLRTYLHIGSTVVTHMNNLDFLNTDVLVYEPRTVEPDIVSMWPPTELSEGYNYEAIQENYVITDDSRILRVYYVQPLQHVSGC